MNQIPNRHSDRWITFSALAVVFVGLALAGCSSSPPTAASTSTASASVLTTTQTVTAGSRAGVATSQAFCQQYTSFIKTISGNIVTPEGFTQFKQGYAALAANAPSAIQANMGSLSDQAQAMQSAQAVTSVTIGTAQTNVDNWVRANCPNFAEDVGVGAQSTGSSITKP